MEKAEQVLMPEQLAPMVDFPLLAAHLTEADVHAACGLACELALGWVTVRPCDLALAAKWVERSGVCIGSVAGYPDGTETTAVKVYAVRDLLQRGARHIETVINIAKMVSRQFQYVEIELLQMAQECHRAGAVLIIDLPLEALAFDHRVIACRIARRIEADYVRPVPAADSLPFFASKLGDAVRLDAGDVVRPEDLAAAQSAGAQRFASGDPRGLLELCRKALGEIEGRAPGV
jgi:deoxyribose-phosphate aldolase